MQRMLHDKQGKVRMMLTNHKSSRIALVLSINIWLFGCSSVPTNADCAARVFDLRQQITAEQAYEQDIFLKIKDERPYDGIDGTIRLVRDVLQDKELKKPLEKPRINITNC